MIQVLKSHELALLILHMNIMKKNVRKALKSNARDSKKQNGYKLFKDTLKALQGHFRDDIEEIKIYLSPDQWKMIVSFLKAYLKEIENQAKKEKIYFDPENDLIKTLKTIKEKINLSFSV